MVINNVQFTTSVKYLDIAEKSLRRKIEDCLQDFNLSYIASPPTPPEMSKIPALMFGQTTGGHSHIQISDRAIKLFVTFDEKFNSDIDKCFDYSYKKIDSIANLLNEVGYEDSFLGMVVQYIFENEPDAINLINRNSIKNVGNQKFANFAKKFSIIHSERYYINFDLSSLKLIDNDNNIVSIVVDINNRYGTECKKEPTQQADIDTIKNLHKVMTEEFFNNLLREGELKLNESYRN